MLLLLFTSFIIEFELSFLESKAVLDAFLSMGFFLFIHFAVGCIYIATLTEGIAIHFRKVIYDKFAKLYAKIGLISSLLTTLFFLCSVLTSLQPTSFSLPFSPTFFSLPVPLTITLLLVQSVLMFTYYTSWKRFLKKKTLHLSMAVISAILVTLSMTLSKLVTSFMFTPNVPEGLLVLLTPDRLDATASLSLLANPSWIPLALKSVFVGALVASLFFAALAVLKRRKSGTDKGYWDSHVSWSYKMAFLFGTPLAAIGFWNAVTLHSAIPVASIALMGEIKEGLPSATAALVGDLSYLWHIGILLIGMVAAFAVAFYGFRKGDNPPPTGFRRSLIQRLVIIAAVFWILDLLVTYVSATILTRHSMLTIYVFIAGFLLLESLWLYSKGRVKLSVPTAFFAIAVLGLLLYIGPFNQWYLSARYGGVPWPPTMFIVFIPIGVVLARMTKTGRYMLPLVSGFLIPLVVICKGFMHEVIRGNTLVNIDPNVTATVSAWARVLEIDISPIYEQFVDLTTSSVIFVIVMIYILFLGLFFFTYRTTLSIKSGVDKTLPSMDVAKTGVRDNRRVFLRVLIALSGASALAILAPYFQFFTEFRKPKIERTKIGNSEELKPNSAKTFLWPTAIRPFDTNILIRDESGQLHAFNRVCTHLQCILNYDQETQQLVCPCHGSRFNSKDGTVANGPASRSLPIIRVEEDDKGDIYAVEIEGEFGYGRE
jgi:Rieske Fe-S protein